MKYEMGVAILKVLCVFHKFNNCMPVSFFESFNLCGNRAEKSVVERPSARGSRACAPPIRADAGHGEAAGVPGART